MKSNRLLYGWLVISVIVAAVTIGIALLWQNKSQQSTPQPETDTNIFSPHTDVIENEFAVEQSTSQQSNQSITNSSDSGVKQISHPSLPVTGSVTVDGADKDSGGMAMAETRDAWMDGAIELERRELPLSKDGKLRRIIRILKTSMKYPLVRVEEEIGVDPDTRQETVLKRLAMCADHVIVKLKPGVNETQLQAAIGKYGGKIRAHKKLSNIYLVELPDVTVDSVPRTIETYNRETDTIAYAEPDYVVTTQDISKTIPYSDIRR